MFSGNPESKDTLTPNLTVNSSTIVSKIHHTRINGLRNIVPVTEVDSLGIDNDIYSTVDACPNACEMWKAIKRLKQGESINNLLTVNEDEECQRENGLTNHALISLSFNRKIFITYNNNLQTSSNTSRANQDNSPRINRGNGAVSKECQKTETGKVMQLITRKDVNVSGLKHIICYHGITSRGVPPDRLTILDQSLINDANANNVPKNNDNYNVFAMENEHPEQPESSNDIYLTKQGDTNITIDSSDICYDRAQDDQDETDDLDQERDLLASLIQKLKCEIDDSKNRNKFLESSNKALVDKLKGEIEDFKTKNKSLESSNNHFKEANNELSKTNQLMFKDLKKF
ncbi:hypothetical protein Tco_1081224 [Tanacetum coccineum]|uniref:Uncharacterized protein n=1 Tax=Tanacetum coccineum TaxID=301880 RepID=A0ABQ5HX44_9ASTR